MRDDAREWWNGWAEQFQEEYGDGEIPVGIDWGPGAPKGDDVGLLGDLEGTEAVELGCGGAQFGVAVAKRGADVTGVDVSAAQLEYARQTAAEHDQDLDLIEASVTDLPVADETFDLAFSAFAFQWVRDLEACLAEAYRVLRPGGRLAFSVDHPFYEVVDHETHVVEGSYFADEPHRNYSEEMDAEMVIYSRKVSEVVNCLVETGFTVEGVHEPGYADPEEYVSEYGEFVPETMAKVPPTVVYAASK